jgi:hypothetical protein
MPVVRDLARLPHSTNESFSDYRKRAWRDALRPYFFLAIFSLITAQVIVAGVRIKKLEIDSGWGAFSLGYFADSTIQKLWP